MTLPAGRKLKMTMLTDDGRLLTTVAEIAVAVPFDATDFLDVLPAEASVKNSKSAPIAVSAPTRGARVVPERALADLKAKFPAAEKRKATVMIKNANQSKRRDVVEVDVPRPDVHARYRGWVMAATPASLPSIVNKLETQLAQDLAGLRGQYGSRENQSANAEAYHSYVWLNDTMRRYIAQLREIAAQR